MRTSVFTLWLCAVFLFSATELHELVKLPCAIMHYLQHSDSDTSYTLSQFLVEHYSGSHSDQEKDPKEHSHLPFKTEHGAPPFFCFQKPSLEALTEQTTTYSLLSLPFYTYLNHFSSQGPFDIWQPPKWHV